MTHNKVPVTIFTGYLGAGKTTIISNLIKQMPSNYTIAWLKNEMGNTMIDSELANKENVATVKEILNGCLCHYMIGSLNAALDEMLLSKPERIVIETSGSATPAPIVWEIRKNPRLITDGVITVIDAINFKGYVNKSYALKIQARYTDLILINKHEDMDERTLEDNLDDLYDINLDTPKIKTDHGFVHSEIIFGFNTTLFDTNESVLNAEKNFAHDHHNIEVDLLEINPDTVFDAKKIEIDLQKFPKNNFYRIKGLIHTTDGYTVINHAFGNTQLHNIDTPHNSDARVVFMGDDLTSYKKLIADIFAVSENDIRTTRKEDHHH